MIDIDDFRQINDKHGHAVGDRVLVAFGQRLGEFCRSEDILVRWSGEEFLLVVNSVEPTKGADLAKAAGKNFWRGLLAGPQVRSARLDKLYSISALDEMIGRGILEPVSSSPET